MATSVKLMPLMTAQLICFASVTFLFVKIGALLLKHKIKSERSKARRRIKRLKNRIQRLILPEVPKEIQLKIASYSINELRQGLDQGDFTSVQILITYYNILAEEGIIRNLISDANIEAAIKEARILDEELKQGHKRGILHGIPIISQDNFSVKGMTSTCGLVKYYKNIQNEDALHVEELRNQGAIIFALAAVSEGLKSYKLFNHFADRGAHPQSIERTPGGSSGGVAALIALRCSALGITSDLFGNIGISSSFCGVAGFKATPKRISAVSPFGYTIGVPNLNLSFGAIGKTVDDCAIYMKTICDENMYKRDLSIPPLPWNEEKYFDERKLKIGYFESYESWPLPNCMARALETAKETLQSLGHSLVKIKQPNLVDIDFSVLIQTMNSWKGYLNENNDEIFNEKLDHEKDITSQLFGECAECSYISDNGKVITMSALKSNAYDYVNSLKIATHLKNEFLKKWADSEIDIIIAPYPFPALLHKSRPILECGFAYVTLFSLLGCPVGNVPVGVVNEDEQFYQFDEADGEICSTKAPWAEDIDKNMKESKGLPICVQIAASPYQDEVCLNAMRQLESKLRDKGNSKE